MIVVFVLVIYPFFSKDKGQEKVDEKMSISEQINLMLNNEVGSLDAQNQKQDTMFGIGQMSEVGEVTQTPEVLVTPTPQRTQVPLIQYVTVQVPEYLPYIEGQELVRFRYSYYYPPLGGVNCRTFENGQCVSLMASGDRWEDWLYKAVACSSEYPLGTTILVVAPEEVKGSYKCLDRGGGIEGTDLLDFLDDTQRLPWLEYVYAYIVK